MRGRKKTFSDEQLIKLLREGKNDKQIGEELGKCTKTICYRRNKLGLPSIQEKNCVRHDDEMALAIMEAAEKNVRNLPNFKRRAVALAKTVGLELPMIEK